jgi:hypothetical protein
MQGFSATPEDIGRRPEVFRIGSDARSLTRRRWSMRYRDGYIKTAYLLCKPGTAA